MKIFKIIDIEKKLNKTVRQDTISIGLDTAISFTGICILRTDKENIYIEDTLLITTSEKDDHFHRADHFIDALNKFKQKLMNYKQFKILVVERCYFGQNPETLIQLAQFGILTYATLKKEFDTYFYLGASTARSIIGFNQKRQEQKTTLKSHIITRGINKGKKKKITCKELVHDYLKTDFGLEFDSPDKADAWVLALAGLLQ